jgi:uncharacterized membrane protein YebE (DUF533 family)
MDFNKIVSGLSSSGVLGGFAGGAIGGALMSNKKVRKHTATLLKVGGIAALGGVAWKAYQGYTTNQITGNEAPATEPRAASTAEKWQGLTQQGFAIKPSDTGAQSRAMVLIQAMITAAHSDGHIDASERSRMMAKVVKMTLEPKEKAVLFDALSSPLSLAELCQIVDCPELAAEVYLCSSMVLDKSLIHSSIYLDALAQRLEIPPDFTKQLDANIELQFTQAA